MRRKAWFFKDRTVLGILGVMLVFITLATGCPTGEPEQTSYTVTFNVDGGSAIASQSVASGGKVTQPADPTKTGYTFAGWYKEAAKTTLWNFDTDVVTANTTLYAKWVTEAVNVTFSGFADEEIDLTPDGDQPLSKSNWKDLTVSLVGVENNDSIQWFEDGKRMWDSNSKTEHTIYTHSFSNLSLGPHTLSVVVVKDGVPYSKTLKFQVSK
jgi:uncharacterized repeat protein (TIGR02543 family)